MSEPKFTDEELRAVRVMLRELRWYRGLGIVGVVCIVYWFTGNSTIEQLVSQLHTCGVVAAIVWVSAWNWRRKNT